MNKVCLKDKISGEYESIDPRQLHGNCLFHKCVVKQFMIFSEYTVATDLPVFTA